MNNKDRYFKGQQENEEYVCFMRNHWIRLTRDFIGFIFFVIAVLVVLNYIGEIKEITQGDITVKTIIVFVYVMATFFIHQFFIKVLNFFVNIGIITNKRLIDHQKTLFFRDNMDAIYMSQTQNIERVGEGLIPNLLGYGDIKIYLNASAGVKTFRFMPNAKFHFRCLARQRELSRNASEDYGAHQSLT